MKSRVCNAFRLRLLLYQLSYVDLSIYGRARTCDPQFEVCVCALHCRNFNSGSRIRTDGLWVMSPPIYRADLSRNNMEVEGIEPSSESL